MTNMFERVLPFGKVGKNSLRGLRAAGDAARQNRDWLNAVSQYRRYLEHRPHDAPIWVQLGHAHKELKRMDDAADAYVNALKVIPNDADALLHLTALLNELDGPKKARVATVLIDSSLVAQGHAVATGQLENSPRVLTNRDQGDLARDNSDWCSAALLYSQYLVVHPGDGAIWVQLGHMLKEQSLFEVALYAYRVGKRLQTEPSDVSVHLASLLMHMGRTSEAKPLWADMFKQDETFFLRDR